MLVQHFYCATQDALELVAHLRDGDAPCFVQLVVVTAQYVM
jgi:hypothetical protein